MRVGRRWPWVAGGVVVVLAAGGAAAVAFTREPRAVASTSDTSRVDRGAVSLAVATTGAVTPARSYALGFGTSGTVSAVAVRAGATVTKGQVLARVDDADARAKVSAAETAADRAADALDAAQRSAQDCARRTTAPTRRATPTQPVTSTRRATPSGRPTPTATTSATRTTSPGRTASPRATATTPAAQDRCAATGADQVLGARRQATAAGLALDEARATLAGTTIRAPIAGTVLALSTAVGAAATPGGTVLTVADPGGMQIEAAFPEADAGRLATGQAATVTLPDRPGTPLHATVVQVDPVGTSDGTLVTFSARLAFEQAPGDLLVGQSAAVRVTIASRPNSLRVPSTAVRADGSVLVRTAAGDARTQVQVGLRGDAYTEIMAGLIDGQEIVTASS